jgi:hypothetical protein
MSRKKLGKALKDPNTVHQVRLSDNRLDAVSAKLVRRRSAAFCRGQVR